MPRLTLTFLDACAVVNLYATRWMESILTSVGNPVAIADVVEQEAQFVYRGGTGDDAREREPVELQPLVASGLLSVISTTDEEELLTFIDLTREIDEGEAMTVALAIHRGCIVVTDDRKASRVLERRGVPRRSTLDVVKAWSERDAVQPDTLRGVLTDLRQRGRYEPARSHPLRSWWGDALDVP
ncbi:MAG: PIN domain-containing protein [Thermomicrobiales bacterium]